MPNHLIFKEYVYGLRVQFENEGKKSLKMLFQQTPSIQSIYKKLADETSSHITIPRDNTYINSPVTVSVSYTIELYT